MKKKFQIDFPFAKILHGIRTIKIYDESDVKRCIFRTEKIYKVSGINHRIMKEEYDFDYDENNEENLYRLMKGVVDSFLLTGMNVNFGSPGNTSYIQKKFLSHCIKKFITQNCKYLIFSYYDKKYCKNVNLKLEKKIEKFIDELGNNIRHEFYILSFREKKENFKIYRQVFEQETYLKIIKKIKEFLEE